MKNLLIKLVAVVVMFAGLEAGATPVVYSAQTFGLGAFTNHVNLTPVNGYTIIINGTNFIAGTVDLYPTNAGGTALAYTNLYGSLYRMLVDGNTHGVLLAVPDTTNLVNLSTCVRSNTAGIYTWTSNLNATVLASTNDLAPGTLADKLLAAGTVSLVLVTNSGSVQMIISNVPPTSNDISNAVNAAVLFNGQSNVMFQNQFTVNYADTNQLYLTGAGAGGANLHYTWNGNTAYTNSAWSITKAGVVYSNTVATFYTNASFAGSYTGNGSFAPSPVGTWGTNQVTVAHGVVSAAAGVYSNSISLYPAPGVYALYNSPTFPGAWDIWRGGSEIRLDPLGGSWFQTSIASGAAITAGGGNVSLDNGNPSGLGELVMGPNDTALLSVETNASGAIGKLDMGYNGAQPGIITNAVLALNTPGLVSSNMQFASAVSLPRRAAAMPTPIMGYNLWPHAGAGWTASWLTNQVNICLTNGYAAAGYIYFITDDGSFTNRNGGGQLVADAGKFPGGVASAAAWLHSYGLKFGLYTEPNATTLGGFVGSDYAHCDGDCSNFLAWGIDYLKLDTGVINAACDSNQMAYAVSRFASNLDWSARSVVLDTGFGYPACGTLDFARNVSALNLWRDQSASGAGPDFDPGYQWWHSIQNFDVVFGQNSSDRPGHIVSAESLFFDWNFPGQAKGIMALAAIAPAPILLAQFESPADAINFAANIGYLTNAEVIDVNQDAAVAPGVIIQSNAVTGVTGYRVAPAGTEIIVRPLGTTSWAGAQKFAACFLERGSNVTATLTLNFTNLFIAPGTPALCRDLNNHTNCYATNSLTVTVGSQTAELWTITPQSAWLNGDGSGLISLNGTNITAGTVSSNALDAGTLALLAVIRPQTNISSAAVTNAPWLTTNGSAAALTGLNGANITAGTVSSNALDNGTKALLSGSVASTNGSETNLIVYNSTLEARPEIFINANSIPLDSSVSNVPCGPIVLSVTNNNGTVAVPGNLWPDQVYKVGSFNENGSGGVINTNVPSWSIEVESNWKNYLGTRQAEFYHEYTFPKTNFNVRWIYANFQQNELTNVPGNLNPQIQGGFNVDTLSIGDLLGQFPSGAVFTTTKGKNTCSLALNGTIYTTTNDNDSGGLTVYRGGQLTMFDRNNTRAGYITGYGNGVSGYSQEMLIGGANNSVTPYNLDFYTYNSVYLRNGDGSQPIVLNSNGVISALSGTFTNGVTSYATNYGSFSSIGNWKNTNANNVELRLTAGTGITMTNRAGATVQSSFSAGTPFSTLTLTPGAGVTGTSISGQWSGL
jgi:Alpha galactosidase A